jgi:outer membrane protein assembly factor BamB
MLVEQEGGRHAKTRGGGRREIGLEELGSAPPRRFVGVTRYVSERLRQLPPEARDVFRERHDYRAKARFEELTAAEDREGLEHFVWEFSPSVFALRALEWIAENAMESGEASEAARSFERLARWYADLGEAVEKESALRRAVLACVSAGDLLNLRRLAPELGLTRPEARLSFGKEALNYDELLQRAAASRGAEAESRRGTLDHLLGNPLHTNSFESDLGLGEPSFRPVAFSRPTTSRPENPNFEGFYRPARSVQTQNRVYPVVLTASRRRDGKKVDEPVALLSTGDSLATIWLSDGSAGPRILPPTRVNFSEDESKVLHGGAAAHGVFVTSFVMRLITQEQTFRTIPIKVTIPERKLCALDTKRWRWLWNHQDILRDTEFAKASFPASPTIVGDTVYAPAIVIEGFVRSYVMAFDLMTGRLKWATWVCSGQVEQTMFGEHAIEPMTSAVVVSEGKVFHCTSLGAIAALDAKTGAPLWVTGYEQVEIKPPKGYFPVYRVLGWANNPPLVSDRSLVVTPMDSDLCLAYDVDTGERRWRYPRDTLDRRGPLEYMVGAENGKVVFSGRRRVQVREASSGRLLGDAVLPSSTVGRGVLAAGRVCLPLQGAVPGAGVRYSSAHIARLDLRSLEPVNPSLPIIGMQGGDLSLVGDQVLVLSPGVLGGFANREPTPQRSRDF